MHILGLVIRGFDYVLYLLVPAVGFVNKYDFHTQSDAVFKARKGLDAEIVNQISGLKNEPEWMLEFRLKALKHFESRPMPKWGPDISDLRCPDRSEYRR